MYFFPSVVHPSEPAPGKRTSLSSILTLPTSLQGCDASVLIDSTEDNIAEEDVVPNLTLRGFDLIDKTKDFLESKCKGIVSCADILALATCDAVAMSGGLEYPIPTGRRDGLVSKIDDVNIPGPMFSIDAALNAFESVGLNLTDLATLLGAHTIGFAHYGFFNDRVYDFQDSGMPDPSMDQTLVISMKKVCPPPDQITDIRKYPKVFLNGTKGNPFSFDSGFYHEVLHNITILQID